MSLIKGENVTTPCYVITLSPQSERVQSLLSALAAEGVDAQTYAGVDGRKGMPLPEGDEIFDLDAALWRHKTAMTPTEVGCYLSHYRLIKDAYCKGLARVCILEDDVALEPGFGKIFRELEALPEDYEMIRLMALKIRKRKLLQPLGHGSHHLIRPERGLLGTQGYMINRKGMQKFLAHASRIFEAIDKVFDHFYEFDLRQFGVEPHIIWEVAQPSSVIKSSRKAVSVPIWIKLLFPLGKLWRSIVRHAYLWKYKNEFYPCEKPSQRPGKSPRLR